MLCVTVGEDLLLGRVSSQSTFSSFTAMPPPPSPHFVYGQWAKTQSNNLRSELT